MTQVRRLLFAASQFIAMLILGVIYIRGYLPMADMVPDSGPFTGIVDTVEVIVPITIGAYLLFVALWVIAGPIQRERKAQTEVRRR